MNNFDPFTDIEMTPVIDNNEVVPRSEATRSGGSAFEKITDKSLTWKSSTKCFNCYDRATKETTAVDTKAEFIPLASSMSIEGSRQAGKPGTPSYRWIRLWSNEFLRTDEDLVVVREKDPFEDQTTIIAEGLYKEVKEVTGPLSHATFTLNVYSLVRGTDDIVKFQFKGSSRELGFEITDRENMSGKCFKLSGVEENTNGTIKFNKPLVEFSEITADEDHKANILAQDIREKLRKNQSNVKPSK